MKPNFFIIGAARSGSTSLYLYLEQHPDIYFSNVKELNFFSNPKYWAKGLDWYESRFRPQRRNIPRIGEASTSYTRAPFNKDVPKKIASYAPDAKFIYIVRNPIDRIISHYLHRVQVGQETRELSEIIQNLENEAFAWQGRYHYQVAQFLQYYSRNQICIVSMDDLKKSPETLVKQIFQFLDVGKSVKIEKTGTVFNANKVTTRKSKLGMAILSFYRRHLQQKSLPYRLKRAIQSSAEIGSTRLEKPEINDDEYQILKNFYEEDALKLQMDFSVNTLKWFK